MFIELILLAFIIAVFRRHLGKLKNKYTLVLLIATVAWWLFLVVSMLRTDLVCTADDAFCNSGNTFWGDVTWGTGVALITSSMVWLPYLVVLLLLDARKNSIHKKSPR